MVVVVVMVMVVAAAAAAFSSLLLIFGRVAPAAAAPVAASSTAGRCDCPLTCATYPPRTLRSTLPHGGTLFSRRRRQGAVPIDGIGSSKASAGRTGTSGVDG